MGPEDNIKSAMIYYGWSFCKLHKERNTMDFRLIHRVESYIRNHVELNAL